MARTDRVKEPVKKKSTIEDDTSILPSDIIPEILSRLPVKSLCRFKSVSKPWNSLISDAKFVRSHLRKSKYSDFCESRALWSTRINPEIYHQIKFTNQGLESEGMIPFPVKHYLRAQALCSYDGLVLLKNTAKSDNRYVIWNPSTKRYTTFLCPYRFDCSSVKVAICHDQSVDDYKILFLENGRYTVFSYANNSWSYFLYQTLAVCHNAPVVVHGIPHWTVEEKIEEPRLNESEDHMLELSGMKCNDVTWCRYHSHHYKDHPVYECDYGNALAICYLDHKDDVIKKLAKPASLDEICVFRLSCLRSQLCLYRNTYDFKMMEIWIMKEYDRADSWAKLLKIENLPGPHFTTHVRPLCFTRGGDIIIDFNGSEFFIYKPSEKVFRKIPYDFEHPLLYVDSFILPRRGTSS